jgi:hypothetical protein
MTELFGWLQRVLGSESRAAIAAVTAALAISVILAIAIFNGLMALLPRLPAIKDKCPSWLTPANVRYLVAQANGKASKRRR